ncbi:MAG TPA: aldehyde dehydrogenase family protein, partial [Fimbriimonadaceae bacterium]|nr:aldehyde dehydrogenase family protein [Fimbriimonadaceae bacterium]
MAETTTRQKTGRNGHAGWDYSPAPESRSLAKIKAQYGHFIGGKFVPPKEGKYFDTIDPSTEKRLAKVALGSKKDVDAAVRAARAAYEKHWCKASPKERGKAIYRIARLIQERSRELAVLESIDGGKPIRESRDVDLPLVAQHFFYYAGW